MATANILPLPSYYPAANEKIRVEGVLDQAPAFNACPAPPGFPEQLTGSLVWNKKSMLAQEDRWIVQLSGLETEAIESALRLFQSKLI